MLPGSNPPQAIVALPVGPYGLSTSDTDVTPNAGKSTTLGTLGARPFFEATTSYRPSGRAANVVKPTSFDMASRVTRPVSLTLTPSSDAPRSSTIVTSTFALPDARSGVCGGVTCDAGVTCERVSAIVTTLAVRTKTVIPKGMERIIYMHA